MHVRDLVLLILALGVPTAAFAAVAVRVYAYSQHRRYGIYEPLPFARGLLSFTFRLDASWRAFSLAAALLVAGGVAAGLSQSDLGLEATSRGTGWAHNLSLVEAIRAGKDPAALAPSLGELSATPAASHRLVAYLSRAGAGSPPATLQAVTAVIVVLGAALVALRVAMLGGPRTIARVLGAAVAAPTLFIVHLIGFGFSDYGDFYPQLCGTVLALGAYLGLQPWRRRPRIAVPYALILGAGLLPFVDGLPAAWFLAAAWLSITAGYDRSLPGVLARRTVACGALALLIVALLAANPAFRQSWELAAANGTFECGIPFTSLSTNLSEAPGVVAAIVVVVTALVGLAVLAVEGVPGPRQALRILAAHAGFTAALLLIVLGWLIHLVTGQLSTYAIVRMLFLLFIEAAVSIALAAAVAARDRHPAQPLRRWAPAPSTSALGIAALLFIAQWPFLEYTHEQDRLVAARDSLVAHAGDPATLDPVTRRYPQLGFLPVENYYLAIGVLRIPRDPTTAAWLQSGTKGAESVPIAWADKSLSQYDGTSLSFKSGGNASKFMLSGWSQPEDFGTWTDGASAALGWRWLQKPEGFVMTVTARANVSDAHPSQQVRVTVNGEPVDTWVFKQGEPTSPRRVVVPPSVLGDAAATDIRFEIVDPAAVPGDPRLLGLGVEQLTAVPLARYDGHTLGFGDGANGVAFLWDGWSQPERGGTWTTGPRARLLWQNALPTGRDATFTLKALAYVPEKHPSFTVRVFVNKASPDTPPLATWQLRAGETPSLTFRVPSALLASTAVTEISFEFEGVVSPLSLGLGADTRQLGLYVQELAVN